MNKEWKLWQAMTNGEERMSDLKLYLAVFAAHGDRIWRAYSIKVVAKNTTDAMNIIANKYGEVKMKSLEEIKLEEGMFL